MSTPSFQNGYHIVLFRMATLYPGMTNVVCSFCEASDWELAEFDIADNDAGRRMGILFGIKSFPQVVAIRDGVIIGECHPAMFDATKFAMLIEGWKKEPEQNSYVAHLQRGLECAMTDSYASESGSNKARIGGAAPSRGPEGDDTGADRHRD